MLAFWFALLPIIVRADAVPAVPIAVFAPRDVTDSVRTPNLLGSVGHLGTRRYCLRVPPCPFGS